MTVPWDEATASWNTFGGDPGATAGDEYNPSVVTSLPADGSIYAAEISESGLKPLPVISGHLTLPVI